GITDELLKAGIPKEDIVLGFHEPEVRLHTGFAIA
ncbi:MAG: element excision factor XisI family protein, partial [Microcystis sp.]